MKNTKVYRFTVLLLCALMALCLVACKSGGEEGGGQRLAVDAQKEKEASTVQEPEEDKNVLRIVTDMDWMSVWYTGKTQSSQGKQTLSFILDYFGEPPSGIPVELEVLPAEEGNYQAALTRLRTRIMAGDGPDVFYLSGFGSCEDSLPVDTLFPNPEHAMASGFFLPLDSYIEDAQFMEWDKLNQTVMKAGQYDGKQYILPMFYRLPMGVLLREADPVDFPVGWEEAVASQQEDIRRLYAQAAGGSTPGFREIAFGEIADNVGEVLLMDEDELFQRTKEALELYREFPRGLPEAEQNASYWYLDYTDYLKNWQDQPSPEVYTFFAPRGGDGEIIAAVEHWCAVNANTKHPEDAWYLVDIMLSRKFLSAMNFWNNQSSSVDMPLLGSTAYGSIPVHMDILTTAKAKYRGNGISLTQREALKEAEESVSFAYLTSNIDREMDRMFVELRKRVKQGEALTDEEIHKITHKVYTTMKMMLAES